MGERKGPFSCWAKRTPLLTVFPGAPCLSYSCLPCPGSSPSEAWDTENLLHALQRPVDFSPTRQSGSHQTFPRHPEHPYSITQVSTVPREQGDAQTSSGGLRVGVVSVPGNVWEGGIYRLLFTKKNEARKTFNNSQLRGTAAVPYLPTPRPQPPAQLLPPKPLGFCQVFQELSLIWLTSAADVCTCTRPTG